MENLQEFPAASRHVPTSPSNTVKLKREDTDTLEEAVAAVADEALDYEAAEENILDTDEATALAGLTENVRDQDDLERDITYQANLAMIEQEDERDQKRIEKVESNIRRLDELLRVQRHRLPTLTNLARPRCVAEIDRLESEIAELEKDKKDIKTRVKERHEFDGIEQEEQDGLNKRLPNESQRDFLLRTGKITPFSRMPEGGTAGNNEDLRETLMNAEEDADVQTDAESAQAAEPRSHQNLRLPGFADAPETSLGTPEDEFSLRPRKKRRLETTATARRKTPADEDTDDFEPENPDEDTSAEDEDDDGLTTRTKSSKKKSLARANEEVKIDLSGIDDGNEQMYQTRLASWVEKRSAARRSKLEQNDATEDETAIENAGDEEWFKPCPDGPDHQFGNGIKLPGDIYPALFDYQKTGVQWLGELYSQQVGGIIGDEMGLGKTIQMISFLAALHYSKKLKRPIIVIAPATVLRQWVNEFHRWWPPLRVSILHSSGSGMLNVGNEKRMEERENAYGRYEWQTPRSSKAAKKVVDRVVKDGHVLVTTYAGLQTYSDILIPVDWDYAVLDEGHKIRNPNTAITLYCKELRTANRIILSGTPMQNNLVELWSLFDFVFPMRLGTLVNFRETFEVPIKIGGYANATNLQIMTATRCAETLKSAIGPYLLQRLKVDVASDLPKKSEQVLLCKLTKPQRDAYEMFLNSEEMDSIMNHTRQSLYGIDILRKICNHPDLLDPRLKNKPDYKWGNPNKSGKMQVVKALLKHWKGFGHKALLFSQGVQMLNIIEHLVKGLDGVNYLRMDGSTNIKDRQTLVDRFNNEPDLHVFLLTTKVGGLGVNLTGANRVIIFDPDWNPSTDVQARERAWRLGQKKEVTIYRLMINGTIEEKIYHRQIYKQFLTNKILKDPKQRQTFPMKDLYDLFTLGSADDDTTETGEMFQGAEVQFGNKPDSPALEDSQALGASSNAIAVQNDVVSQDITTNQTGQGDSAAEVRALNGVSSLETYRGDPSEDKPSTEESRLMEGIFARSGVHSALEHDQIINGKRKIAPDHGILEREAKRVAAEAAKELRISGEAARHVTPGTVTWTGEFGSSGRPTNIRRAGPSSAGIMAGLANRQGLLDTAGPGRSSMGPPAAAAPPRAKDFGKLIREFIIRQGGSVPTQNLVNHFDRMCHTAQQSAEFKHILGEIAVLDRSANSRKRGRWTLKEEFK